MQSEKLLYHCTSNLRLFFPRFYPRSRPRLEQRLILWVIHPIYLALLVGLFALLSSTTTVHAQLQEEPTPQSQLNPLQRALNATVRIQTYDFTSGHTTGLGSGTIIHEEGYVLTNYHVIEDSKPFDWKVYVLLSAPEGNNRFAALLGNVIAINRGEDLAIVKFIEFADGDSIEDIDFPTIPLGDSSTVQPGDNVYSIGYPDYIGNQRTLTSGIVSGRVTFDERLYLSTDVDLSSGNSGGALIDKHSGELIGIPTLINNGDTSGTVHGFTRPINVARRSFNIDPETQFPHLDTGPAGPPVDEINILCADDFSTNVNGWGIGYSDNPNVESETLISGEQLIFATAFKKDAYTWLKAPECDARNAIMMVDAQIAEGSGDDVGVMFLLRYRDRTSPQGQDHLRIVLYADNTYKIDVRFQDEWTSLEERTYHRALRLGQGEVNRIAIAMHGEYYQLHANDVELATVRHSEPTSGRFALGIIGDAGHQIHVRLDNFVVGVPQSGETTFYDDFVDNRNNWLLGEISTEHGDVANDWIRNGYLEQKVVVKSDTWESLSATFDFTAIDLFLQTRVALVDTNEDDSWISILLRYDRNTGDFYRVRLSPDGFYRIDVQQDGELYNLQSWTRSSTIQLTSGKWHDIAIWLRGQRLTLSINGIELTTVQDNRVRTSGVFAFGFGGPKGTESTAVYDEVIITEEPLRQVSLRHNDPETAQTPNLRVTRLPTPTPSPTPTFTSTPTPTPTPTLVRKATVVADTLNVRSGPSISYGIVSKVSKGTVLTILSQSNDRCDWLEIQSGGLIGWISGSYVRADGCPLLPPPTSGRGQACIPFENHFRDDATITMTGEGREWTFKVPGKQVYTECFQSGDYTWSIGLPCCTLNGGGYIGPGRHRTVPIYRNFQ